MKNLFYWVGLPVLFIMLAAATFLIPKTYESKFVIIRETQLAIEHNRVMTLNRPENYDLGVLRTDNVFNRYAYEKIIYSDAFIRALLEMPVKTVDGSFEGSCFIYLNRKNANKKISKPEIVDTTLPWISKSQEAAGRTLRGMIDVKLDFESQQVTIRCTSEDPLVSTQLAQNIQHELAVFVRQYELDKMEMTLSQLHELTQQAKAEWEKDPSNEKEQIYKSFARQEVVYKAQMMNVPAFSTLSEPSFSYRKVAPSRWKLPFIITVLVGAGVWGWRNRKRLVQYI